MAAEIDSLSVGRNPEGVALTDDDLVRHRHPSQIEPGNPAIPWTERRQGAAVGEHSERQPAGGIRAANAEAIARGVAGGLLLHAKFDSVEGDSYDGVVADDVDVVRVRTDDDWNVGR